MNINDIYIAVSNLPGNNVYDLIDLFNLEVIEYPAFSKRKIFSSIMFDSNTILIQPDLEGELKQFLLWHELGHYILHFKNGDSFNFYLSRYKSKFEVEANMFAFMGLLKDEDLAEKNIIDLAIRKGMPQEIATMAYDNVCRTYLSHSA